MGFPALMGLLGTGAVAGAHYAATKVTQGDLEQSLLGAKITNSILIAVGIILVGLGTLNYFGGDLDFSISLWAIGGIVTVISLIARRALNYPGRETAAIDDAVSLIDSLGGALVNGCNLYLERREWDYGLMTMRLAAPKSKWAKYLAIFGIVAGILTAGSSLGHFAGFSNALSIGLLAGGGGLALISAIAFYCIKKQSFFSVQGFAEKHPTLWKALTPLHFARGILKAVINAHIVEPLMVGGYGLSGLVTRNKEHLGASKLALISSIFTLANFAFIFLTPHGALATIYTPLIITTIALLTYIVNKCRTNPPDWHAKMDPRVITACLVQYVAALVIAYLTPYATFAALGICITPYGIYEAYCAQRLELYDESSAARGSLAKKMALEQTKKEIEDRFGHLIPN